MTRCASGESVRPACHMTHTSRGRIAGSSSMRAEHVIVGADVDRQHRHHRGTHAGADHRRHGAVVGGPEHDQRFDSKFREGVLDPPHVAEQSRERHHLHAVELFAVHRTVWKVASAAHEHIWVVEQLDRFDRTVERSHPVRQVELAGEQSLDRGVLLEHADVDCRLLLAQLHDDLREQHGGHALERADVDPALAGLEPFDRLGRRLGLLEQFACVGEHQLAERRDAHRLGAARAIEDGASDRSLEGGDLLAHRRLRVTKPLRRPSERTLRSDGVEGQEVADLEAGDGVEKARLGLDGHPARIARTISVGDRLDR